MWRVVDKYVMSMPDRFVQAKLKFQEVMAGVREYKRWSACLMGMMEPMGMTLGRLYVDANFDESTKMTVSFFNIDGHSVCKIPKLLFLRVPALWRCYYTK